MRESMSPRLVSVDSQEQPAASTFKNNAMARLWENAQDRETGAEAVVAIRARHQNDVEAKTEKHAGRLQRFLLGRS
jgi:uncharacterized protein YbjQ (UPF0145 family)